MFSTSLNNGGHGALVESYLSTGNFYRIYSDGWCEQGGNVSYGWGDGNLSINLLKTFRDTEYYILLAASYWGETKKSSLAQQIVNKTTSSFESSITTSKIWYACGYIS